MLDNAKTSPNSPNKVFNTNPGTGMSVVNLETLKENKIISKSVKKVKIFGNTAIESKVTVEGINVTKGAKESIEKAGGKIVDANQNKEAEKTKEINKGDKT